MRRRPLAFAAVVCAAAALSAVAAPLDDALTFLRPEVQLTADERQKVQAGGVIARVLPSPKDEVAVIGVTPVNVPPGELLHASRDVQRLRRSPQVLAMGRFSTPPILGDLDAMALDDEDLESIRECRPGNCGVKLSDGEMRELQAAAQGRDWKDRLQRAFRAVVLARVRDYVNGGLAALPPTHDHSDPVSLQSAFLRVLSRAPTFERESPALVRYLRDAPGHAPDRVEWYLYWSKEKYGGKPVIRVAHVAMQDVDGSGPGPGAVVVEKQLFATHYIDAFLGVTTLSRSGGTMPNGLVYMNRSEVDFLGGFFGPIKRAIARREIESYLAKILALARTRLEATN
jgi:hypothetical protein